MAKSKAEGFGVFKKDDQQVVAWSIDEAVRYRFDGWEEVAPALPENQPEADADASA